MDPPDRANARPEDDGEYTGKFYRERAFTSPFSPIWAEKPVSPFTGVAAKPVGIRPRAAQRVRSWMSNSMPVVQKISGPFTSAGPPIFCA